MALPVHFLEISQFPADQPAFLQESSENKSFQKHKRMRREGEEEKMVS